MIIYGFHIIRFPSTRYPDLYGIAVHTTSSGKVTMSNGRSILEQGIVILSELNPDGLITKEELENYCSGDRLKDVCDTFTGDRTWQHFNKKGKWMSSSEVMEGVRQALLTPTDNTSIKTAKYPSVYEFFSDWEAFVHRLSIDVDIPAYVHSIKKDYSNNHRFYRLVVGGQYICEEQRKDAERDFYVIRINSDTLKRKYVCKRQRTYFDYSSYVGLGMQFLTENGAFRYIEKHIKLFGEHGYEVEKVEGVTLEKGFYL